MEEPIHTPGPDEVAGRIAELLAEAEDEQAAALAEEAVALVVQLYGAGLERVVRLLDEAGPEGHAFVERLAADQLVGNLLIVHDLHPLDTLARVTKALDGVRPYLGSHAGGVELLGIDEDGVARLRLQGSCDGCPSSAVTVKLAIERAILEAAPEVVAVDVENVTPEPSLLQISSRPPGAGEDWTPVDLPVTAAGQTAQVTVHGAPLLVARLGETRYVYRDVCTGCGSALGDALLAEQILTCVRCGSGFDVRLAGRAVDGSGNHLDPVPLIDDEAGARLALPMSVGERAG